MSREEAITVLKAFMENPLFSDQHKAAFNIAIHDIKQRHDWDINNLILINKDNYEPIEQEATTKNDLGVERQIKEICISYPKSDLKEHDGQPYYSVKYIENGVEYKGYGTYKIEVFMEYLRNYFMPSVTPQEPRWIPVSERLPKDNKYYLVTIELTFSRSNRYVDIQNAGGWDSLRKCGHEVVAWMPLPKAYKPWESEDKE